MESYINNEAVTHLKFGTRKLYKLMKVVNIEGFQQDRDEK